MFLKEIEGTGGTARKLLVMLLLFLLSITACLADDRNLLAKAIEEALSQNKSILAIPENNTISLLQFQMINRTSFKIDFTRVKIDYESPVALPSLLRVNNWNETMDADRGKIAQADASALEAWDSRNNQWSRTGGALDLNNRGPLSERKAADPIDLFEDQGDSSEGEEDREVNDSEESGSFSTRPLSRRDRKVLAEKLQQHLTEQENMIGGTLIMKGDLIRAFVREGYKIDCIYRYLGDQGYDVEVSCKTQEKDYRSRRQSYTDRGDPYSNPTRFVQRPRRSVKNPFLMIIISEVQGVIVTGNKTLAKRSTGTDRNVSLPADADIEAAKFMSNYITECGVQLTGFDFPTECVDNLKVLAESADCYYEFKAPQETVFKGTTSKRSSSADCSRLFRIAKGEVECSTVNDPDFFEEDDFAQLKKEQETPLCSYTIGNFETKIRDCKDYAETIEKVQVLYSGIKKMKTIMRHGVARRWYDPSKREFYECSKNCQQACGGDKAYRTHIERHGRDENGVCKADNSKYYMRAIYNGLSVGVGCVANRTATLRFIMGEVRKVQPMVLTSCVNGVVNTKPLSGNRVIRICSSSSCVQLKLESGSSSFIVPTILLGGSSSLLITDYSQVGASSLKRASCSIEDSCDVIDCTWCFLRFAHPHCLSTTTWLVLVAVCSILLATVFVLLTPIARGVMQAGIISKTICVVTKIIPKRRQPTLSEQPLAQIGNGEEPPAEPAPRRRVGNRLRLPIIHVLYLVTTALANPTFATHTTCHDFSVITSETLKCNEQEDCKNRTTTRIVFDELLDESCLLYEAKSGSALSTLHIKIKDVHFSCSEDVLYYVPDVKLSCDYKHRCAGVGSCSSEECANFNKRMGGGTNGSSLHIEGCLPACGCWGCGCFLCTDSCLFYNASLVSNTKRTFKVLTCSEALPSVTLIVTTTSQGREDEREVVLSNTLPKRVGDYRVRIESVSTPDFGTNCYMISDTSAWEVPCNKRGELVKGRVGEVQCETSSDASVLEQGRCKMSGDIIKVEAHSDEVTCLLDHTTPYEQDDLKLPLTRGKNFITLNDKGAIISSPVNGIGLTLLATTDMKLTQLQTNENTCSIRNAKVSGCYSCRSGAVIKAEAISTPRPETAVIVCPNAESKGLIWLSDSWKQVAFGLRFNDPVVKETCTIVCSGSNVTFSLSGNLQYMPNHDPRTISFFSSEESEGEARINWEALSNYVKMPWVGTTLSLILMTTAALVMFPIILRTIALSLANLKKD